MASCQESSLYRVERLTGAVADVIHTGLADPTGELSLAAEAGSIWILSDARGVLSRIDPQTNRVVATIPVAPHSFAAAFGFGSVWITNTGEPDAQGAGSVQCIDPQTGKVAATIPVGVSGPGGDIAAGAGRVWIRATEVLLSVIDPSPNRVFARFGPPAGSGGVHVGDGIVWVTAHDTNTVWA